MRSSQSRDQRSREVSGASLTTECPKRAKSITIETDRNSHLESDTYQSMNSRTSSAIPFDGPRIVEIETEGHAEDNSTKPENLHWDHTPPVTSVLNILAQPVVISSTIFSEPSKSYSSPSSAISSTSEGNRYGIIGKRGDHISPIKVRRTSGDEKETYWAQPKSMPLISANSLFSSQFGTGMDVEGAYPAIGNLRDATVKVPQAILRNALISAESAYQDMELGEAHKGGLNPIEHNDARENETTIEPEEPTIGYAHTMALVSRKRTKTGCLSRAIPEPSRRESESLMGYSMS